MTKDFEDSHDRSAEMPLARKVGRMGMLIHRYYDAQAHRHGALGDPLRGQGRVLALLKAKPTTTQRELSFLLDMRQQSLSELLGKLEEKGFITREKSPDDGRVTVVTLTDEGAAAAPSPDQMQAHPDALDCLTDEERAQLETITEKVCTSLEGKLQEMGIDPHQGPRPRQDRDRGPRDDRRQGPRDDRGPRQDRDRGQGYRGPREDRGYRGDRDRGQRDDRGYRGDRDRGPRDRGDRGPSHRGPYRPDGGRDGNQMRRADRGFNA